jgi:hypothetical protein
MGMLTYCRRDTTPEPASCFAVPGPDSSESYIEMVLGSAWTVEGPRMGFRGGGTLAQMGVLFAAGVDGEAR